MKKRKMFQFAPKARAEPAARGLPTPCHGRAPFLCLITCPGGRQQFTRELGKLEQEGAVTCNLGIPAGMASLLTSLLPGPSSAQVLRPLQPPVIEK